MSDPELRVAKAIAAFDAKRQLLAEGWDVESFHYLTWSFDVQPAEPNDDRGITIVAHFEDMRVRGGAGSDSPTTKAPADDKVITNPPPMPEDRDQYWISATLRTGDKLTIGVSLNPLNLRGDDRILFYDIVDTLTAYQNKAAR